MLVLVLERPADWVLRKLKKYLTVIIAFSTLVVLARVDPSTLMCVLNPEGAGVARDDGVLLAAAKERVTEYYGELTATPTIRFFDSNEELWPLSLNPYGSAAFLGFRTCIFIGPKGRGVDVVAHELVHAEITHRVGYVAKVSKLPVWFDEGLAMQVDFRSEYHLDTEDSKVNVRNLSGSEFFAAKDDLLTVRYASAKLEVEEWVSAIGPHSVFERLEGLKTGLSFAEVFAPRTYEEQ